MGGWAEAPQSGPSPPRLACHAGFNDGGKGGASSEGGWRVLSASLVVAGGGDEQPVVMAGEEGMGEEAVADDER